MEKVAIPSGSKAASGAMPILVEDALLECLVIVCRVYHKNISKAALTAGLPLEKGKLNMPLLIRAAERAGFFAKSHYRNLHEISRLNLPAILLFKDERPFVLMSVHGDRLVLLDPDANGGKLEMNVSECKQLYSGRCIFLKPKYVARDEGDQKPIRLEGHWFWSLIQKTWHIYAEVLTGSLFVNLFAVAGPLFIMNVYDRVVPNNAYDTLWMFALGMLIVYIFDFTIRTLRGLFIDLAAKKNDFILQAEIFEKMLGIKMAARPNSTGIFANHIHQFEGFREFFNSATLTSVIDVPFVFLYLAIIFMVGGPIVIVPLLAIPVVLIIGFLLQGPLNKSIEASYQYSGRKQALMYDTLSGVESIKASCSESGFQYRFEQLMGPLHQVQLKSKTWNAIIVNSAMFIQQLTYVLVVVAGVYLIGSGKMTTGALVACTILSARAIMPLTQVASLFTKYYQAKISLKAMDDLMDKPTDYADPQNRVHKEQVHGNIQFKNVSFSYNLQENRKTLYDVSFSIKKGEKVAIVGRMGSGKTSLLKLILGLYTPQEGGIFLDEVGLKQLDLATVRRNIGHVPQDIHLFQGSIRDNITMGSELASEEMLLEAAHVAGVIDFIKQNPEGFAFEVGEFGARLSGGQRQAVAIARALLLHPSILLFDEPTAALDSKTEETFLRRLITFMQHKTLLVVTHKPTLLPLVDRLIVMEQGRIVADGPRDTVLQALNEGKVRANFRGGPHEIR